MSDDKRLNEVIRVHKRPNSYTMLDTGFLNNSGLSWKAKGILAYLLSKPDNWKVIVGNIVNNATDGKTSVYNGLAELNEQGYYEKVAIRSDDGRRIDRWESTVYELPKAVNPINTPSCLLPGFQEIDNQDIDNQDIENQTLTIFNNNYIDSSNIDVSGGEPPAPAEHTHGEFKRVRMTEGQYGALVTAYGQDKAADYINRLDRHIASTNKRYSLHYATIKKWIDEDGRKATTAQTTTKKNRFCNFEGRKIDYDELERLEQQRIMAALNSEE